MRASILVLAFMLASCKAAEDAPSIEVGHAWARATVGPQNSSAAYFAISNAGGADALVRVTSPAGDASLHSTSMDAGVMRMRPLERLEVPANSIVSLKPGGTHIMITGLKAPLTAGSAIRLDLKFERSGDRQVTATVKPASTGGMAM